MTANQLALGRNYAEADSVSMTQFYAVDLTRISRQFSVSGFVASIE